MIFSPGEQQQQQSFINSFILHAFTVAQKIENRGDISTSTFILNAYIIHKNIYKVIKAARMNEFIYNKL